MAMGRIRAQIMAGRITHVVRCLHHILPKNEVLEIELDWLRKARSVVTRHWVKAGHKDGELRQTNDGLNSLIDGLEASRQAQKLGGA